MREYLTSLVIVCAMCAVMQMLTPDGSSISHGMSFAMAVVILFVVVLPIPSLLSEARDSLRDIELPRADGTFDGVAWVESVSEEAIERALATAIEEEFDIRGVRVDATLEESAVTKTEVVLTGASAFADGKGIKKYVEESLGCVCEVILFGE